MSILYLILQLKNYNYMLFETILEEMTSWLFFKVDIILLV